jgi:hypothetical protein
MSDQASLPAGTLPAAATHATLSRSLARDDYVPTATAQRAAATTAISVRFIEEFIEYMVECCCLHALKSVIT